MQTRLTNLYDVRAASAPQRNARLSELASLEAVARRNATAAGGQALKPVEQQALSDFIKTLLRAYGWRPNFHSVELPRRIPYLPRPYAVLMVDHFARAAEIWLRRGALSLQPNFIKNRVSEARHIVSDEASYEQALPMVALKAALPPLPFTVPGVLPPAATRPHGQVLTAPATWKLLDRLGRLARHLDALADAPTMADLWSESWDEAQDEALDKVAALAEKTYETGAEVLAAIPEGLSKLANAPGKILDAGKSALTTAALIAGGVLLVYLVSK